MSVGPVADQVLDCQGFQKNGQVEQDLKCAYSKSGKDQIKSLRYRDLSVNIGVQREDPPPSPPGKSQVL